MFGWQASLVWIFVMYRRFSGVSSLSRFSIFGDFLDLFFGFSWRRFEGVFLCGFREGFTHEYLDTLFLVILPLKSVETSFNLVDFG